MVAWSTACGRNAPSTAASPAVAELGTFVSIGGLVDFFTAEPLVSIGWDGRPVLRVLETAHQSADGRTLTLTLRRGVRFHNQEPVTAEHVRELLLPKIGQFSDWERQNVEALHAAAPDVLVVRLREPNFLQTEDLHLYSVADDRRPGWRTGPFRVESLTSSNAVLSRFDAYHQGGPELVGISIRQFPTQRAAWTALMRGEINAVHEISREAIEFLDRTTGVDVYPLMRPYLVTLGFNMAHRALGHQQVRAALAKAVDREDIIRIAMRGHGRAANGPFWPHHWAYPADAPDAPALRRDLAGARQHMESAGAPGRSDPDVQRFGFTCLVLDGDLRFERIALVLQRQLFDIGVNMQIVALPRAELQARLKSGDYDAFLFEMTSGRTLNWVYRWWHSREQTLIRTGYAGADDALDRMRLARTDDDVRQAVADVARVLREDPPAIFLVWPRDARALDSTIDVPYEPDRDVFGTLWRAHRREAAR